MNESLLAFCVKYDQDPNEVYKNIVLYGEHIKMKATLEFNLPEEQEEFDRTQQAGKMHSALWDIGNDVFRPARKHGYSDSHIQGLIERLDKAVEMLSYAEEDWPKDAYGPLNATDLIRFLEEKYHAILREHGVDL